MSLGLRFSRLRRLSVLRVCVASLILPVVSAGVISTARAQQSASAVTRELDLPDAPGLSSSTSLLQKDATGQQAGPAAPATVAGTILNTNGGVVQGARVVLSGPDSTGQLVVQSGSNGQFTFSGLPAETYKLTVSALGMGTVVTPDIALHAGETRFLSGVILPLNAGVTEVRVTANQEEIAEQEIHVEESQRVLGVFPNFYTSFEWCAAPMNTRQKFQLAFRSMIDPMAFLGAAALAGGEQVRDIDPVYGENLSGFAKRFGAAYANDFDGRMLGSAVFPSLFHQDPRYFYKGTGSARSRALYAVAQTFVCRGDNGRPAPNYSEVLGSFAAGGLSNLYYPAANRGVSLTFVNGLIEIGGHAGTNLLREFLLKGLTTRGPSSPTANP